MDKRNVKRPPARQSVYPDREQANLKAPFIRNRIMAEMDQCTQLGA